MRTMVMVVLCFSVAPVVVAEVEPRVYLSDANTYFPPIDPCSPYIYPDIMVGTTFSIIVESNMPGQWDGGLFITAPYRDNGILSGRDYNDVTDDWEGSHLEAAGIGARVIDWQSDFQSGFDLYGHRTAVAGDWFIIDYVATDVGSCEVGFYDYGLPDGRFVPKCSIFFSHVPTRDFNNDTVVSFNDFAIIVAYWQSTTCADPDWCEGADLDRDRDVDFGDVKLFAGYWLEKTE